MMPTTRSPVSRVGVTVTRSSRLQSHAPISLAEQTDFQSQSRLAGRAAPSSFAARRSPDRDGSLSKARYVGALGNRQQIKNTLGGGDRNDYVRFEVAADGHLRLDLKGLTANADVQLLGSSGRTIAIANKVGKQAESITCALDAGTYYVRVHGQLKTRYTLNLATTVEGTALAQNLPPTPD
ncbi:MAG: hypothetical protein HC881_07655 [Leptolyngbyaceae cyanobacterium SL_7_1]|nr:hypothetical protein [Leptolyngbyaceae cyanobacterium SL_7_1]